MNARFIGVINERVRDPSLSSRFRMTTLCASLHAHNLISVIRGRRSTPRDLPVGVPRYTEQQLREQDGCVRIQGIALDDSRDLTPNERSLSALRMLRDDRRGAFRTLSPFQLASFFGYVGRISATTMKAAPMTIRKKEKNCPRVTPAIRAASGSRKLSTMIRKIA